MHITTEEGLKGLEKTSQAFLELFKHGSLNVEIYKPELHDKQTPHDRDEIYVIIAGSGVFVNDGHKVNFKAGDFLFVPAGIAHRFSNFTTDFSTWVFFYGPEGGELT